MVNSYSNASICSIANTLYPILYSHIHSLFLKKKNKLNVKWMKGGKEQKLKKYFSFSYLSQTIFSIIMFSSRFQRKIHSIFNLFAYLFCCCVVRNSFSILLFASLSFMSHMPFNQAMKQTRQSEMMKRRKKSRNSMNEIINKKKKFSKIIYLLFRFHLQRTMRMYLFKVQYFAKCDFFFSSLYFRFKHP